MISRQHSVEEADSISHCNTVPISFRNRSIRSSLSSLYKNYDFHLDILKLTGVVVLLSIMSATLAITSNLHVCKGENTTDCIKLTTQPVDLQFNSTLCSYMKQYQLPGGYYTTVCSYQGYIRIDVRKFINDRPTIQGFFVNTRQWNYLKRLKNSIDKSISEARAMN